MAISREKIHSLVEVFYQPTFKTFYVNSVDGENFTRPVGIFVSLGITTAVRVLEYIRDILVSNGYKAELAELSSKQVSGQYLNTVTNTENPGQYELKDIGDDVMGEDKANDELHRMKNLMTPDQSLDILKEYAPKISKLQDLINKLTTSEGWKDHAISVKDGDYGVFHKKVNYEKRGDLEFRLGICVYENDNN